MTSSGLVVSVSTDRTGLRSGAAVVIAAVGPLAIAVLRLILPYDTTDDTAATVEKVAAAPAVEGVVLWLTYLALLTLPLGVLIAARQAIRARPVLGAVAAVVAWLGFTSLFASVAIGDYLAQAAPQQAPRSRLRLHCWMPSTRYPRPRRPHLCSWSATSSAGSCSASRWGGPFPPDRQSPWPFRSRCISFSPCSSQTTCWMESPGH
jgi:hypothetical protein